VRGKGDLAAISLHTSTSKEPSTIIFSPFSLPHPHHARCLCTDYGIPLYIVFVFNLKNVLIIPSAVCFCFMTPFRYTCCSFNTSEPSFESCRVELKLSYGSAGLRSVTSRNTRSLAPGIKSVVSLCSFLHCTGRGGGMLVVGPTIHMLPLLSEGRNNFGFGYTLLTFYDLPVT